MDALTSEYSEIAISNGLNHQKDLDLTSDRNKNIFAYKGQFSPDLIKGLLMKYTPKNSHVLDPFCGCGTALFEAAKQGHSATGIDINPAGVLMAETVIFHNIPVNKRNSIFKLCEEILDEIPPFASTTFEKLLIEKITNLKNQPARNILINAYLKYSKMSRKRGKEVYKKILFTHIDLIKNLPYNSKHYKVIHSDIRKSLIKPNSVDLIITSPPYINVFNYHQHYRAITEKIGYDALHVAKSEFGSNRKNRQNRFLTVTQYVLDMAEAMNHLKPCLKSNGRFIIVIGRQSTVRSIPFRNDILIGSIGLLLGYNIDLHQERKFKNQFGETIYEDIIHLLKENDSVSYDKEKLMNLIEHVFNQALTESLEPTVRKDLLLAIKEIRNIPPSPVYIKVQSE